MPGELTTMDDDIRSALQELQGGDRARLPAERTQQREEQREERLPATRREESLPENREQEAEDEREHPDEREEQEPSERREVARRQPTPAPGPLDTPPVSWRGPVKAEWKDLSESVRREITRRERDMAQTLSRTDEERRYAHAIFDTIQPYEHHLRAENVNHQTAVQHLFAQAHIMRSGTTAQKAELLAELLFRHDVPVEALDAVIVRRLGGKPQGQQPDAQLAQLVQQELAPIRQFMQTVQQSRAQVGQHAQTQAQQSWQALLDDPEIGDLVDEVRQDIADILDIATKHGRVLPLRDAAVRAIMAHAEFAPIYQQRQLDKKAQELKERANKSRRAGASLEDEGAPPERNDDGDDDSIEGSVRSSIRELNRQRR